MRMLRIALTMVLGLALTGTQALAQDDYGSGSTGENTGESYGTGGSGKSTGQQGSTATTQSISKQATIANDIALYDQQASAMADLATQRSQDPKVLQYARDVKAAHERNLASLKSWADQKKVEIASVALTVPSQGAGGSGMTDQEKKAFDEQLSKYGSEFSKDAKAAQDDINKLSKVSSADFDKEFLSKIDKVHKDQIDAAKDAKGKYTADAAFTDAMASTESTFAQLNSTGKSLEDQLKK